MDVDIVELAGDAFARGLAYGRARRQQIQACLGDWMESLRLSGIVDPQPYIEQMLHETDFLSAIEKYCPDLIDEIRGIADGSGQSFGTLYAMQLMDEEWAYRASSMTDRAQKEKCSSVAIRTSQDTVLIGQNMDLGAYTDGHQVVFRLAQCQTELGALIFSTKGMIALFGVNTNRIGVCVNSIPQLLAVRQGLPVAFFIRKLLQSKTLSNAVEMLKTIPHATGQHYLIADAGNIRSFEASSAGVVEYVSADPTCVLHTNHPLAQPLSEKYPASVNSTVRLESLRRRLGGGQPDLEAIKAALSSSDDPNHPVSRVSSVSGSVNPLTGRMSFTTGSMISVLHSRSESIEAWVSPGPPSQRGYTRLSLP